MYGWPGLIGIGVIAILWYLIQKQMKKTTEINTEILTSGISNIMENIKDQNNYLVKAFAEQNRKQQDKILELLSQSLNRHDAERAEKHNRSIDQRFKISYAVMDRLTHLMNYHNAERVSIIEFHNSKENLNGLSFVWYDVQYEVHQKNVIPIAGKCKDMQVSRIYNLIDDIFNKGGICIYNDNQVNPNIMYHDPEVGNKVKAVVYSGIYNKQNDLIGLIALEFIKDYIDEDFDTGYLANKTSEISTLLDFNDGTKE